MKGIGRYLFVGEGIEEGERIVDGEGVIGEMIGVVVLVEEFRRFGIM